MKDHRETPEKMEMHLLGAFCLKNKNAVLTEESLRSNKLTRLLVYLLINRDREIPHQELIGVFDGNDCANPQGTLKNLMYRLRTVLKALGEEEFICTSAGVYFWNPRICVETDYERFEERASVLCGGQALAKKKEFCQELIEEYRGNITRRISKEPWMIPRVVRYRALFLDIVKQLAKIYEEEAAWEELELLCKKAAEEDALDEDLHYWILEGLHGQGKDTQAIRHYEEISRKLYEHLGLHTTEKLKAVFRKILRSKEGNVADIRMLTVQLEEPEAPEGAFLCDYPVFLQIYRVEVRRNSRLGISEYLVLMTLRRTDGVKRAFENDPVLTEGMRILRNVLKEVLRTGDAAARYRDTQYIILLPTCSYEGSILAAERIRREFDRRIGKKHLELVFEVDELSDGIFAGEKRGEQDRRK